MVFVVGLLKIRTGTTGTIPAFANINNNRGPRDNEKLLPSPTPSSPIIPDRRCPDRSIVEGTEIWRDYCSGCQRPEPQCLCDHLPPERIGLETRVLIVQHPVEFRRKTISTVPLLKLVLRHCRVLVGRYFDDDARLEYIMNDALFEQGLRPLLLFP